MRSQGGVATPPSRGLGLGSGPALVLCAALVTLATAVRFLLYPSHLDLTLGDTDDAMRLVMVRDLLAGRGWYDQWIGRLQPPVGTYMHWSRLLDAGLAGLIRLFEIWLPPPGAERMARLVWPLAWIAPAAAASLSIARSLGGPRAMIAGVVLLVADSWAFVQFQPGRIDHHNVQITLTLAAAALALARPHRIWRAALCGACSALALAIGVESLVFHALIGLGWGLALVVEPSGARAVRAYGLALALATAALFLIQTPPVLWTLSVCDALGWNLTAAVTLAGLGLAGAAWLRAGRGVRVGLLVLIGLVASGVYLGLNPACLHGPVAAVDPRLKPFWFDRIEELKPWPRLFWTDRTAAVRVLCVAIPSCAAALVLLWRRSRAPGAWIAAACVLVAVLATAQALRLEDYEFGFGLPVLAAAVTLLTETLAAPWTVALALALAPAIWTGPILGLLGRIAPSASQKVSLNDRCYETAAYAHLAALPPGLVLADINLGPFILAQTKDSVLAAPYHRMSWGMLAAHAAQGAPPDRAEAQIRRLGVRYVVECGGLVRVGPGSFEFALRRGRVPGWLKPLSAAPEALKIYAVRPLTAPPSKEP
jgi:hypothetical protein